MAAVIVHWKKKRSPHMKTRGIVYLSIKARNLCVSVYCLKYLCRSGSDWAKIFNMAAAWFEGVQCRICLDYNYTVNELFHEGFTNSTSIVNYSHYSHHTHVHIRVSHCRAHPPRHTLRNKQIYTCSSASWTGILPAVWSRSVHLNWLLWINETERVRTESIPVWGDLDTGGRPTS